MNVKTKNYLIYAIGLMFLAYGGVRLGVSSLLLLQSQGILAIPDLQEGLNEVTHFMANIAAQALVPFSTVNYLFYLWIMGTFLVVGAVGCLLKKRFGLQSLCAFFVMWSLLFVNFQTINPKVLHLFFWSLLAFCYWWLTRSTQQNDTPQGLSS